MLRKMSSQHREAETEMENKGITFLQDSQIQRLLANFLRLNSTDDKAEILREQHLDEDTAAAFVEGNLNFRQSAPIINHLIGCSFCRHITAELVKLDLAFAEVEITHPTQIEKSEPAKISEALNGLLSRIFGSADGAVFAHQEHEKEIEKSEKTDEKK